MITQYTTKYFKSVRVGYLYFSTDSIKLFTLVISVSCTRLVLLPAYIICISGLLPIESIQIDNVK